jgi:adenosylcobinamide-phosphate synthase
VLRDGNKHTSPDSGYPEAAMAGSLGIRLGGPGTYTGIPILRSFIDEAINRLSKNILKKQST